MRPHEEHAKYEPLEQAAEQAARFLTALIKGEVRDAQAEDVRNALLAGLVRTGYAEREAQNQVLRDRLSKASRAHRRQTESE